MRKAEFEITDTQKIQQFLDESEYGTLSLIAEGEPYGVALNYVMHKANICFHGAKEGRKAEAIKANPHAAFLVVKPYSLIPSYFSDTRFACPATQFFASVHAFGKIEIVEDLDEKAEILEAMMQKLQSKGGYETITSDNPIYTKVLEKTGMYLLKPQQISMKVKAGQNLSKSRHVEIIEKLQERGDEEDLITAAIMQDMKTV